ncbi:hypothetical protein BOX15_Mlig013612g1 [Macrostomum lignano]|uniref:UBR-type domain-containing protein n=3 Tax=Macrostomum lignano TaxID=282301 RepID=A0A267EE10_9PLAT|nr:hypothetical protein BOX15_Mlig013612g1 [Macrostomum lignano]
MLGRQTQQTQQHQLLLGPAGLLAVSRSLKALLDSPSLLLTGANSAESSASSSVADLRPLDAYHSPERLRGLLANVASCQCLLELLDLYLRSALETASQQLQAPQPRQQQQQQRLAVPLSSGSVSAQPPSSSSSSSAGDSSASSDDSDSTGGLLFGNVFEEATNEQQQKQKSSQQQQQKQPQQQSVTLAQPQPSELLLVVEKLCRLIACLSPVQQAQKPQPLSPATIAGILSNFDAWPTGLSNSLQSALSSASVAFHRCLHSLLTECPTGQTDQFRSSLSAAVGFPIDASNQPLPLRSSWRSLSVAVQVIFLRLEAGRSTGAEDRKLLDSLWLRLFASLSTGWLARNAELLYTWPNQLASSGSGASDLGPEVAQLMQLLFFARQQRREALNLTVNLFCQLVSSVPKKPTQLLNPLPISRLCLLMASFVQYYYDPPDNLMRQLKYSFFGQFLRPTSSQATVAAATAADSASCGTLAAVASDEDLANRLLYYELPPVPAPSVSKPDNLALDCLMSNPDTYDQIYSACLGLLRLTWRVNALSNNSTADYRPDSMRALEYHWRAANRLLNLLPPSGWFLRTCDSGGLEPPSGDILADRFDLYCVAQLNSRYFTARRQVFANLAKSTGQAWIDALFEEKLSACGTLAALTAYVESYFKDVKFGEFTNNSSCGNPLPVAMLDAAVACLSAIFSDLRSGGEGGDHSESTASSSRRLVSASGGKVVALAKLSSADTPASVLACANRLRQPLIDIAELCGQAIIDWLVQTDSQHCGLADYELQLCRRLLAILSGPGGFKDSSACLPEHIRRNMDVYDALDGRGCQQQSGSTPAHSLMEQTVLLHLAQSSATGPACLSYKRLLCSLGRLLRSLQHWWPSTQSVLTKVGGVPRLAAIRLGYAYRPIHEAALSLIGGDSGNDLLLLHCLSNLLHDLFTDPHASHSAWPVEARNHPIWKAMQRDTIALMTSTLSSNNSSAVKLLESTFQQLPDSLAAVLFGSQDSLAFFNRLLTRLHALPSGSESGSSEDSSGFPPEHPLTALCKSLADNAADVSDKMIQSWLEDKLTADCSTKLSELAQFAELLVKESSKSRRLPSKLPRRLLKELLALKTPSARMLHSTGDFPAYLAVLVTLAFADGGSGHRSVARQCLDWLNQAAKDIEEKPLPDATVTEILTYLRDLLAVLGAQSASANKAKLKQGQQKTDRRASEASEESSDPDQDDNDDDDGDDYDDDGEFICHANNETVEDAAVDVEDDELEDEEIKASQETRLCTYTYTAKEFHDQHWYNCHTCKFVDGVGVCSVCARLCHRGHDLTYNKFGAFFCDCGAKGESFCQALNRRSASAAVAAAAAAAAAAPPPSRPARKSGASAAASAAAAAAAAAASRRRRHHQQQQSKQAEASPPPPPPPPPPSLPQAHHLASTVSSATRSSEFRRQIESHRDSLCELLMQPEYVALINRLLSRLAQPLLEIYKRRAVGNTAWIGSAYDRFYNGEKIVTVQCDQLLTTSIQCDDGAFDRLKLSYSGEEGQQLKALLANHNLARVPLVPLCGRQCDNLILASDQGRISTVSLKALVNQAVAMHNSEDDDLHSNNKKSANNGGNGKKATSATAMKRKLLSNPIDCATLHFQVVHIAPNPANDSIVSVCGLRECRLITLTGSGSIQDVLVVTTALESNTHIIKSIWLPGSPSELAIVTPSCVKIFNTALDVISPQYYFLIGSGSIRDATFVGSTAGDGPRLLIMSSNGAIFSQKLAPTCAAESIGAFTIATCLEFANPLPGIRDSAKDQQSRGKGGVSLHYSAPLGVLLHSYTCGASFCTAVPVSLAADISSEPGSGGVLTAKHHRIDIDSTASSKPAAPLTAWRDVPGHPGLLTAIRISSQAPVLISLEPDKIASLDLHASGNGGGGGGSRANRSAGFLCARLPAVSAELVEPANTDHAELTVCLALHEDGSVRFYFIANSRTGYWLQPEFYPRLSTALASWSAATGSRRGSRWESGRSFGAPTGAAPASSGASAAPAAGANSSLEDASNLPVDFFESCQEEKSVEFGGPDFLHCYTAQRLKQRLTTQGDYIACSKSTGGELTIKNPRPAQSAIVGIRVHLGLLGLERVPVSLELHGRIIPVRMTRPRWFDLPFTRSEILASDSGVSLKFGPSADSDAVTIIDSVKVYVQQKSTLRWPADASVSTVASAAVAGNAVGGRSSTSVSFFEPAPTSRDRVLLLGLEAAGNLAALATAGKQQPLIREAAVPLCESLLLSSAPKRICVEALRYLRSVHSGAKDFHKAKDATILRHCVDQLQQMSSSSQPVDQLLVVHLVSLLYDIGQSRPDSLLLMSQPGSNLLASSNLVQLLWDCAKRALVERPADSVGLHRLGLGPPPPVEGLVAPLVQTLHACCRADARLVDQVMTIYSELLLHRCGEAAHACRQALGQLLRKPSEQQHRHRQQSQEELRQQPSGQGAGVAASLSAGQEPSSALSAAGATAGASGSRSRRLGLHRRQRRQQQQQQAHDQQLPAEEAAAAPPTPPPPAPAAAQELADDAVAAAVAAGAEFDHEAMDEDDQAAMMVAAEERDVEEMEEEEEEDEDEDPMHLGAALLQVAQGFDGGQMDDQDQLALAIQLSLQEGQSSGNSGGNSGAAGGGSAGAGGASGNASGGGGGGVSDAEHMAQLLQQHQHHHGVVDIDDDDDDDDDDDEDEDDDDDDDDDVDEEEAAAVAAEMHLANEVMAAAMELDATASADSFDIVGSQSQPALSAAATTGATTSDGDSDAAVAGVSSSGGVGRSGGGGGSNSASGLAPASASVVGGSAGSSRRAPQPRMSLAIRRALLAKLRDCLPEPLASSSGQSRCVPFLLQLYPLLTTAAAAGSADDELVNNCLEALFDLLPKFSPAKAASFCTRTPRNELCLMVLRLLSELLAAKLPGQVGEFIAKRLLSTAESDSNFLDFALACIKELDRSQQLVGDSVTTSSSSAASAAAAAGSSGGHIEQQQQQQHSPGGGAATVLRLALPNRLPDCWPLLSRDYVRQHHSDLLSGYAQLLTELVFRLPTQLCQHRGQLQLHFSDAWYSELCELTSGSCVRRLARRLLLAAAGNSKDLVRRKRDLHAYANQTGQIRQICAQVGVIGEELQLSYQSLLSVMDSLKACVALATARPGNWQWHCFQEQQQQQLSAADDSAINNKESIISFLLRAAVSCADNDLAENFLQLLLLAVCPLSATGGHHQHQQQQQQQHPQPILSLPQSQSTASKQQESNAEAPPETGAFSDHLAGQLARQFVSSVFGRQQQQQQQPLLLRFVKYFLCHSSMASVRSSAHAFLFSLHRHSASLPEQQLSLLQLVWQLWHELPTFSSRAERYVDLLGYLLLSSPQLDQSERARYCQQVVDMLTAENARLTSHFNFDLYTRLQNFMDLEGFYLEQEPCQVCHEPDQSFVLLKLMEIKSEVKFSSQRHIFKLDGSYTISRIAVRLSEVKRGRMIRCVDVLYNSKSGLNITDLKNNRSLWSLAKRVSLSPSQSEIIAEFSIPIVACSLMFEYSDFYETSSVMAENMHCPRCSQSVPVQPGVCPNCNENVFQCVKCRHINYDERDAFLCTYCGHCRYVKFDFSVTARPCAEWDAIEDEAARQKTLASVQSLLEQADKKHRTLLTHRAAIESALAQLDNRQTVFHSTAAGGANGGRSAGGAESGAEKPRTVISVKQSSSGGGGGSSSAAAAASLALAAATAIDPAINTAAGKYCVDCKAAFAELTRLLQKVTSARRQLFLYDNRHSAASVGGQQNLQRSVSVALSTRRLTCFGCATASVSQCLALLTALVADPAAKSVLQEQGLVDSLLGFHGDVKHIVCLITKDSEPACRRLCSRLLQKLTDSLAAYRQKNVGLLAGDSAGLPPPLSVRSEVDLLLDNARLLDSLWERRLACLVSAFHLAVRSGDAGSQQPIAQIAEPCLQLFLQLLQPSTSTSASASSSAAAAAAASAAAAAADRRQRLAVKYANRWLGPVRRQRHRIQSASSTWPGAAWISKTVFGNSAALRLATCDLLETLTAGDENYRMLRLLLGVLPGLSGAQERGQELLALALRLLRRRPYALHAAVTGLLDRLSSLITNELSELTQQEAALSLRSDLSLGFALKAYVELVLVLLEQPEIKRRHRETLVSMALDGYVSLKRLVMQRSKLIEESQERLLSLLEELTSASDDDRRLFIRICFDSIRRCPPSDYHSPSFILDRVCSLVTPHKQEVPEFFMVLEKDPSQEEFLHGRIQGSSFSSRDPQLGPLMRNVKAKICKDTDMVSLADDDTAMELLVDNKIISLDLPVAMVYKKVWAVKYSEGEPMRIVFRIRGLSGDATEDLIESFEAEAESDEEETYRMTEVVGACGGLTVLLRRLDTVPSGDLSRAKQFISSSLNLLELCLKVSSNRQVLLDPGICAMPVLLKTLNTVMSGEMGFALSPQVLAIMERVLCEADQASASVSEAFARQTGDAEQLLLLLKRLDSSFSASHRELSHGLVRLLPSLAFGDDSKMSTLIEYFSPYLNFPAFDKARSADDQLYLEYFCKIAESTQTGSNGRKLRDLILQRGIVAACTKHLLTLAPESLASTDPSCASARPVVSSNDWERLLGAASARYILRLLIGCCTDHAASCELVAKQCVPLLHGLEQVSSTEQLGPLAESLLDTLRSASRDASAKIEATRQRTREEKKRLAMAQRQKALQNLKMSTNSKGQVRASLSAVGTLAEDVKEESGLVCCICREGYRHQPVKVLGIYTFSRRTELEELEARPRKTQGISTVTAFTVIHIECHVSAVKHSRERGEWDSAFLHNGNVRCNGLLPLYGPAVQALGFASCLSRHHSCLQEATQLRDINYHLYAHDLKLLLLRFARERSFSDETLGGGRQSNAQLLPYLLHLGLHLFSAKDGEAKEEPLQRQYLEAPAKSWLEASWTLDGPYYRCAMSFFLHGPRQWAANRLRHLRRLLYHAHAAATTPVGSAALASTEPRTGSPEDYRTVYKPALMFFGLIDSYYRILFVNAKQSGSESWAKCLTDYLRHNDAQVIDCCNRVLRVFEDDLLPCESIDEFFDCAGLLEQAPNPMQFLKDTLEAKVGEKE